MSGNKKSALPFKETEHYSNILLLAPDGQPLAAIPSKRARWYKKRNLVKVLENRKNFTEVLQLLVEPLGRPSKDILPLVNQCVVCGCTEELSCHHVVPRAIRSHFPPEKKEHSSTWCVLVCEKHHLAAEKLARLLYEKILQEATAIAHRAHTEFIHKYIEAWKLDKTSSSSADLARFHQARKLGVKIAQEACVQKLIENFGGYEKTKELFKQKFLELEPKFLPEGFLVDK